MKLNHLDLQVSDVTSARQFFEAHFGFRCLAQRKDQLAILEDDEGFAFGLSNLFGSPPPAYPKDFHIGFVLQTEAEVRATFDRLRSGGVEMRTEVGRGGPNVYFMCTGPDGIGIEVRAPADA